jgi:hypothetical protein
MEIAAAAKTKSAASQRHLQWLLSLFVSKTMKIIEHLFSVTLSNYSAIPNLMSLRAGLSRSSLLLIGRVYLAERKAEIASS